MAEPFPPELRAVMDEAYDAAWKSFITEGVQRLRAELTDADRDWEERVGDLVEKAMGVRRLDLEEDTKKQTLMMCWRAAEGILWREEEDRTHRAIPEMVDDCHLLYFAVFGLDPNLVRPALQHIRETEGDDVARMYIEKFDLSEID